MASIGSIYLRAAGGSLIDFSISSPHGHWSLRSYTYANFTKEINMAVKDDQKARGPSGRSCIVSFPFVGRFVRHMSMEGHSGQKCNLIATCIPLHRTFIPLDRTFVQLDRTFMALDRTFLPLDHTSIILFDGVMLFTCSHTSRVRRSFI